MQNYTKELKVLQSDLTVKNLDFSHVLTSLTIGNNKDKDQIVNNFEYKIREPLSGYTYLKKNITMNGKESQYIDFNFYNYFYYINLVPLEFKTEKGQSLPTLEFNEYTY